MTKIIPYRGLIMVKPMKYRPVSRVVTTQTVLADRSGNIKNMPGVENEENELFNEMHFLQGEVIHVGLGYPEGAVESQIPGMEPQVPRQVMDTMIGDIILYSFNNPLNPVFEIEMKEGTFHLMREDAVMTIFRN